MIDFIVTFCLGFCVAQIIDLYRAYKKYSALKRLSDNDPRSLEEIKKSVEKQFSGLMKQVDEVAKTEAKKKAK